jgi:Zn-dependent metalloprotease
MKKRYRIFLPAGLLLMAAGLILSCRPSKAQESKPSLEQTVFSKASIEWSLDERLPEDIRLEAGSSLNEEEFLTNLRETFGLPAQLKFIPVKETGGPGGDRHIRYAQLYNGLEVARSPYILHLKEGRVKHAHGQLIGEPEVNLAPTLDREEAFRHACAHLGLEPYEARKNSALMSRLSLNREKDRKRGRLMLSKGSGKETAEQYRLVYCFDITTRDPLRRYDVEIDAHSGELVGNYPTLYHENIPTRGNSLYNGEVDIVISDTIFKEEWPDNEAYWHVDDWNAYQASGTSWWMADTAAYSPGGYSNDWYVVLETDPIQLTGPDLQLTFYHRYAMESPAGASDYDPDYDGWDGINVRISTDGGLTWEVLASPVPAYTCTSLWSFGGIHLEGPGIPGWAGRQLTWTRVRFDLSSYQEESVNIRFDFASDGGYASMDDNTLFGWQLDEIEVRNGSEVLYANSGTASNIQPYSIANWVGRIEGKYRLRETTRGDGIATINAESGLGLINYVDFVQDTFPITSTVNRVGVSVHWASENTYDYYLQTFGRNSYDDDGAKIISYANWSENDDVNNAFWAGSFAAYGAGDGILRESFGAIDVVGHEITHGVTDYAASLVYRGESGALNESFSDIFGAAVEFYAEGLEQGDWLMGEDVYKFSGAIRSMQDPKALSSPDTYMGEYWIDTQISFDNGGVHYNSGVQNHWFYLLTEGGAGENDDGFSYQVSGIGLDDASHIAYSNLSNYLFPNADYMDAATYSIQAAADLFGEESQQVQSVRSAWEAVGIYMDPRLTASDTLLEFESAPDESDYKLLVLRNKSIQTLDITGFQFSDTAHFRLMTPPILPLQIQGGDSIRLWLVFTPETDSLYDGTLTIASSDQEHPVTAIQLSGQLTGETTGLPGTEQVSPDIQLSVSPNPFSERLLISYRLPQPEQITVEIRDITGKLLYQRTREAFENETIEIIWGSMPQQANKASGIYLLTFRTGTRVLVKKLIKQ